MLEKIKSIKLNKETDKPISPVLIKARRKIILPAVLTCFTILTTVIMLFAMTTAWYSNVVNTSGLMFEAEAWGFEGEVAVQNTAVKAAPGDSGIVDLTVTNHSDTVSAVTVNITKQYMDPEQMLSRIYFYVEDQAVISGEPVSKQYLTNYGGYTYTLYNKQSLILGEKVHTDALLKWEWVYDVLGYYVRMTDAEEGIAEYLRPVEYQYDYATFDENGNLLTVDGKTTVNEFLAQMTATDGYAGAYSVDEDGALVDGNGDAITAVDGYYPISSEEGNSVWLYLCTRAQIEENTRWDTQFGQAALENQESSRFQARISVSAQQQNIEPVMAGSTQQLGEALAAAEGGMIRLANSMTLTQPLELSGTTNAILDLNGYNISYEADGYAFTLGEGDDLTVVNGTITGDPDLENSAFYMVGGQITMSNITMNDMYMGVNIEDHKDPDDRAKNSVVRIVECELTTEDITVKINGDGSLSGENTCLIIQDSVLTSEGYVGVMGNGNASGTGQWGTDIQIVNSEITGYYSAIYHPQMESTLTVSNSILSGMTGIAVKGGSVYIYDSVISGTGNDGAVVASPTEDQLTGSGWLDTGDGVYVESDYEKTIHVEINGESQVTANASTAYAVRKFPDSEYVTIRISGGTYSHDVSEFLADGCTLSGYTGNYVVE